MLSEPLEPLLRRKRADDAGAPRAIAAAEAVSMMPEPLEPLLRRRRRGR
jgi:hypothetical protein